MANGYIGKKRRDAEGGMGPRTTIDGLLRNGSGGNSPKASPTSIQAPMKNGGKERKYPGQARKSIGQLKRSS